MEILTPLVILKEWAYIIGRMPSGRSNKCYFSFFACGSSTCPQQAGKFTLPGTLYKKLVESQNYQRSPLSKQGAYLIFTVLNNSSDKNCLLA